MDTVNGLPLKFSKACDQCKIRKVRCIKALDDNGLACFECIERLLVCHFSPKQKRVRRTEKYSSRDVNDESTFRAGNSANPPESINNCQEGSLDEIRCPPARDTAEASIQHAQAASISKKLYVDQLLENRGHGHRSRNEDSTVKAHHRYVSSSGVAFFSETRISYISNLLGHSKVSKVIETLDSTINSRMSRNRLPPSIKSKPSVTMPMRVSGQSARSYILGYFTHIHPLYPFLDRQVFEKKAFDPRLAEILQESPPFSALYHTILAIGCQYQGGGSFEPYAGASWELFGIALTSLSDILVAKETILNVQAVLAMAIFAHNSSCLQVGNTLTAEVGRMAQSLGMNRGIYHGQDKATCHRTFWVIYILEKLMSFACSRTSVIADYDIGIPIPEIPEAVFGQLDWFYSMARFSRLTSKAYETFFSISAIAMTSDMIQVELSAFNIELERWRASIPEDFRPGSPFPTSKLVDSNVTAVTLKLHYHYYSVVIALSRLVLSLPLDQSSPIMIQSRISLLRSAQIIAELTRYIDVAAYTPLWILGVMPLTALFILFDFVIHNPNHLETRNNLSLLGIVAGYFCQLDFASDGGLQTSPLSDLAHIARDYVQEVEASFSVETRSSLLGDNVSSHTISADSPLDPVGNATLLDPPNGSISTSDTNFQYPIDGVLFSIGESLFDGCYIPDFFSAVSQEPSDMF